MFADVTSIEIMFSVHGGTASSISLFVFILLKFYLYALEKCARTKVACVSLASWSLFFSICSKDKGKDCSDDYDRFTTGFDVHLHEKRH